MGDNSVLITGIGLISSMGEGADAHWQALTQRAAPHLETERFAPYTAHKLGEVDWSRQIPRRSDQRQMETWQRLGTYAAGLALEDAGLKGDEAQTSQMDMVIAAGGGERDIEVDAQILQAVRQCKTDEERGAILNQMLMTELRPTLFLAQLSNLLAGNISIVHKITGSSRTFMGEEGCGLAALETAFARIRSGQSSHILVGASYNAEHYDMLLGQELNSYLKADGYAPIWARQSGAKTAEAAHNGRGLISGTGGAFLVLESADHAAQRGASAYASLDNVAVSQINRQKKSLSEQFAALLNQARKSSPQTDFAVSGTSGVYGITAEEKQVLTAAKVKARAFSTLFGHMREAQFPFAVALAALAVKNGKAFAPLEDMEQVYEAPLHSSLATIIGIDRAEGVAHLTKA